MSVWYPSAGQLNEWRQITEGNSKYRSQPSAPISPIISSSTAVYGRDANSHRRCRIKWLRHRSLTGGGFLRRWKVRVSPNERVAMVGWWPSAGSSSACQDTWSWPSRYRFARTELNVKPVLAWILSISMFTTAGHSKTHTHTTRLLHSAPSTILINLLTSSFLPVQLGMKCIGLLHLWHYDLTVG